MTRPFVKRRRPAPPGTIPDRLQLFAREVRFYREIAPAIDVRVPACDTALIEPDGSTLLVLEDLSAWRPGAAPTAAARTLRSLHDGWPTARERWNWLPRADVSELVADLFATAWSAGRDRPDLSPRLRDFGDRLVGRVAEAGREAASSGTPTLIHGDASANNLRTSSTGEIALLDWEDVGFGPGTVDLAWHLVSSVEPASWDETLAAYGPHPGLAACLPDAGVQAYLSLLDTAVGSESASGWVRRLEELIRRV